jgi:hypothetical protein
MKRFPIAVLFGSLLIGSTALADKPTAQPPPDVVTLACSATESAPGDVPGTFLVSSCDIQSSRGTECANAPGVSCARAVSGFIGIGFTVISTVSNASGSLPGVIYTLTRPNL